MNVFNKKCLFLLIGLLIICLGGFFFLSRQQGESKASIPQKSNSLGPIRLVPTPTQTLLFSDNFADNSQNWNVGNEAKYSSIINNGVLTLNEANHKPLLEPIPSNSLYDDFTITTSVTLLTGEQNDSVGLYLRANSTTKQGYSIAVYGNDTYAIAQITVDTSQKVHTKYLATPQPTSILHPKGQKNNLTVIMKGADIVLLINDTVVKSVSDGAFAGGSIMLFVENGDSSDGVTAAFDAVAIYDAPERLPN